MKTLRFLFAALALGLAGAASAQEAVPWGQREFLPQFNFFTEQQSQTPDTWAALEPEQQAQALAEAREPALRRQEAVNRHYAAAMAPWNTRALRDFTSRTTPEDLAVMKLWLGSAKAAALERKLAVTRAALSKAEAEGLTGAEVQALAPHLTAEAIADLRAIRAPNGLRSQAQAAADPRLAPKTAADASVERAAGALRQPTGGNLAKFFDGNTASGDAGAVRLGDAVPGTPARAAGAPAGAPRQPAAGASEQPRGAAVPALRTAAPPAPEKSSAWTSDAYGFTITANGRTQTFRDQRQAEAAIRALPAGSVSKIIFYGHGSPGLQTVGPADYEAGDAAALLRGKMARGGVIQFSGCNTAGIGDATLNPAVGISMLSRRLLYFSIPYLQDRFAGRPAAESKEMWEKTWNADLARDTSRQVRGAVVCGYRTFGLVPGRLPGLTRAMGNQEATTPGYVAGKIACYQDGREVPAP
jgi:hypothetical protein